MASLCETCRFGYPEPNDDGYYCETKDEVNKMVLVCGTWGCKLCKIGTPEEFEHSQRR